MLITEGLVNLFLLVVFTFMLGLQLIRLAGHVVSGLINKLRGREHYNAWKEVSHL